jgi:hypothetical protein
VLSDGGFSPVGLLGLSARTGVDPDTLTALLTTLQHGQKWVVLDGTAGAGTVPVDPLARGVLGVAAGTPLHVRRL